MPTYDEFLGELLEEDEAVLGQLADVVQRGRMQAEDLGEEHLDVLVEYDLVAFLVTRAPRQPIRTWVYPTPLGLRVYATLEREAEREEEALKKHNLPNPRGRTRREGHDAAGGRR